MMVFPREIGMMLAAMTPGLVVNLVLYVFYSLGLYTMAKYREIRCAWLAWIPVANIWLLGSLSDQYRYVVYGQVTHRRTILLTLQILSAVLRSVCGSMLVTLLGGLIGSIFSSEPVAVVGDIAARLGMTALLMGIPMLMLRIAEKIAEYVALYDVYNSCDPENGVLFLVFSILFGVTKPFFLFFNRYKEAGMPPRMTMEYAES